jgi:hypothetical protein
MLMLLLPARVSTFGVQTKGQHCIPVATAVKSTLAAALGCSRDVPSKHLACQIASDWLLRVNTSTPRQQTKNNQMPHSTNHSFTAVWPLLGKLAARR